MTHIVVAGGTGQVGKPLCRALIDRGYDVVLLSRRPTEAPSLVPGAADYIEWHPGELGAWATAIDGAAAVVNLAGAPFFRRRSRAEFDRVVVGGRVEGNRSLAAGIEAATARPPVYVSASAVGYYGFTSSDEEVTEFTPAGTDRWADGVRVWEAMAVRAERLGVRVVCARTGIVFGPDEGMAASMIPQYRRGFGPIIASGNQWLPWIHIDDVVGLYLLAILDDRVHGGLNVSAPTPVRFRDFAVVMGRLVDRPVWLRVPGFAIRAALGDVADSVLRNRRMIPAKALELGYRFEFPTVSAALADIVTP